MKAINRKLLRDSLHSRGMILGIASVIFLGVALYGAAYLAFQNLKSSYDYSYRQLRFADFTIKVGSTPADIVPILENIPGISAVTGRNNIDLPLLLSSAEPAILARVISVDAPDFPSVNAVKIDDGSYFSNAAENSVMVEKSFAEYHHLKVSDTLSLVIAGQPHSFEISGIASSPEYIFAAKSRQELLISPRVFGVLFIPQTTLQQITGTSGFNEFCFTVDDTSSRQSDINAVQDILTPYGVQSLTTRENQASNAALSLDLQEFGELADIFPLLFLVVGGLATYILLARMIQNQRGQIGTMRAVGYTRRQVQWHYLEFALIIGTVGAIAGTIVGYFLSTTVTNLYVTILGLPYMLIEPHWLPMAEGLSAGILPCFVAGYLQSRRAAGLRPAEAMRTPPPLKGGRSFLENLIPFSRRLPVMWKMPLRNIFRNRNRSISIIAGVAFGISLVLVSATFIDSADGLLNLQFQHIQKYDASIQFAESQPARLATTVKNWDDTQQAYPVLKIPVHLTFQNKSYDTLLVGMDPTNDLYVLFDPSNNEINIPTNGILLAEPLKAKLGVSLGDTVNVKTAEGEDALVVAGYVKQPLGSLVFVSLEEAQRISGSENAINIIMLKSTAAKSTLINQVNDSLPPASIEFTSETESVVAQLFSLIKTLMWVMLLFGALLALAVLFTLLSLSIIERRRELASMRTIGMGKLQLDVSLITENLWLGLFGLLPGLLLGYALAIYLFSIFQTDIFSFSMIIMWRTWTLILALTIIIVLLAQIPALRGVNRLDLARVIKEQVS